MADTEPATAAAPVPDNIRKVWGDASSWLSSTPDQVTQVMKQGLTDQRPPDTQRVRWW